jgi:hypothetical protein
MKTILIIIAIIAFKCYLLYSVIESSESDKQREQITVVDNSPMNEVYQKSSELFQQSVPTQDRIDAPISFKVAKSVLQYVNRPDLAEDLDKSQKDANQ